MANHDATIRAFRPGDLPACRSLWAELTEHHREIYDDPEIGGDDPGQYIDAYLANAQLRGPWVAEIAGKIVGLAGLIVESEEAEIEPVVVSAQYRSLGIGRLLLDRVAKEAAKLEIRFLNVRPVARNAQAIAFFIESGFDLVGHIELFKDLADNPDRKWTSGITLHGRELRL